MFKAPLAIVGAALCLAQVARSLCASPTRQGHARTKPRPVDDHWTNIHSLLKMVRGPVIIAYRNGNWIDTVRATLQSQGRTEYEGFDTGLMGDRDVSFVHVDRVLSGWATTRDLTLMCAPHLTQAQAAQMRGRVRVPGQGLYYINGEVLGGNHAL